MKRRKEIEKERLKRGSKEDMKEKEENIEKEEGRKGNAREMNVWVFSSW